MNAASWILLLLLLALSLPPVLWWGSWLLYALLSLLPVRPRGTAHHVEKRPAEALRIDVLIPAHNEEVLLPRLLETLRLQTAPGRARLGRILVIADHCTDRTASLARAAHADVLERERGPRGKPAALRDGIAVLQNLAAADGAPPRAVLILDADCTVSPNLLEQTAAALDAGARATQAAYVLDRPAAGARETAALHAGAEIAFALKNEVRPRGMAWLRLPCQLFGTGMCLTPAALAHAAFRDHLTEDLAMSYDLLLANIDPAFLPAARVRSPLPVEDGGMTSQKMRWEAGQFSTWFGGEAGWRGSIPAVFARLIRSGRLRAAAALLDWSVPPLTLAGVYAAGVGFADGLAAALGWAPWWIVLLPTFAFAALAGYLLLGGFQIAGPAGVGRLMWGAPRFLLWKSTLYAQMALGRTPRAWVRTSRTGMELRTPVPPASRF